MPRHRFCSVELKKQVVQAYLGRARLHRLANRYGLSRNLVRPWPEQHESGGLTDETALADSIAA